MTLPDMFPKAPPFGFLRLARLSDVPRIGVVAASGFYHSSWWTYERPYADSWPQDTLASYKNIYRNLITNPDIVVLVAEDSLDMKEKEHVYEALSKIYPDMENQIPPEYLKVGKAIVGITSLKLLPNSSRSGQFQPDGPPEKQPEDPDLKNRDHNPEADKLFNEAIHKAEKKYFKNRWEVDTVVVHPAYWKRGHGSALIKWQLDLADMDQVSMGVAASGMGQRLFEHMGFTEGDTFEVPAYKDHPQPLKVWVGLRDASGSVSAEL